MTTSPLLPPWFTDATLALGVSGGIAAYKSADLIRHLQRSGAARVLPLLTPTACEFITPLTLSALAKTPALTDPLAMDADGVPAHIRLAQQADALLIVPATANILAKLAHGLSDDIVSCTALAFSQKPLLLAPAMNTRMWQHPITQQNIALLASLPNVTIVPPTAALLACGETGEGHLAPMEHLLLGLYKALHPLGKPLLGKRVLVTAGGTQVSWDVARRIGNHSSGKMGLALADEAYALGAEVTLLYANTPLPERPYTVLPTPTVEAMLAAALQYFPSSDYCIKAAAVSDFRPCDAMQGKLKKQAGQTRYTLELETTPDILATLCQQKQPHQCVVGFAAESDLNEVALQEKLHRKGCDYLACNQVGRSDSGFDSDNNEVLLLSKNTAQAPRLLEKASKTVIARQLWQAVLEEG